MRNTSATAPYDEEPAFDLLGVRRQRNIFLLHRTVLPAQFGENLCGIVRPEGFDGLDGGTAHLWPTLLANRGLHDLTGFRVLDGLKQFDHRYQVFAFICHLEQGMLELFTLSTRTGM